MKEPEMDKIAEFIDRVIKICLDVQAKSGKLLKDFVAAIEHNEDLLAIKKEVEEFSTTFPLPGVDITKFKN
jgi:glycine hydroxymethyltransferase